MEASFSSSVARDYFFIASVQPNLIRRQHHMYFIAVVVSAVLTSEVLEIEIQDYQAIKF